MPIGAIAGQLALSAGQGVLQQGFNAFQNRTNLNYYNMQRQHAQEDWRRDTAYNDPSAQVQRLKKAGISPHTIAGHSAIVSAPQSKQPSIGNAPSAYQVNNSSSLLAMRQGLEQLKGQQLANQKTEVEIEQARENLSDSKTRHGVYAETGRAQEFAKIWQAAAQLESTNMDIAQKRQQVENMKEQLQGMVINRQLKEIEKTYYSDYLRGRNQLQTAQTKHIAKDTERILEQIQQINIHNEQDVKQFVFKLEDLQQRIRQLKLDNTRRDTENIYLPEHLRQREEQQDTQNKLSKEQLQYLQTLPPEVRYFIEKSGGQKVLELIMKRGWVTRGKNF